MLPILVKLEHVFHVGHDHSLRRPGADEAAGDQRDACSRAACAWVGARCPTQRSGCREPSLDVQCARDMQCQEAWEGWHDAGSWGGADLCPGDCKLSLWLAWHVVQFSCFARFRCVGPEKIRDLAYDANVDMHVAIM
jgi:hypothetical protein